MIIDERKKKLIDLLVDGRTSKTDIAKMIGVSRQTIYEWLDNDHEILAEVDRQLTVLRNQVDKQIKANLAPVVDELLKIALTCSDSRTRNNACQYLINRVLGTPTSNVNISEEPMENTTDILAAFEEAANDVDKGQKYLN